MPLWCLDVSKALCGYFSCLYSLDSFKKKAASTILRFAFYLRNGSGQSKMVCGVKKETFQKKGKKREVDSKNT